MTDNNLKKIDILLRITSDLYTVYLTVSNNNILSSEEKDTIISQLDDIIQHTSTQRQYLINTYDKQESVV